MYCFCFSNRKKLHITSPTVSTPYSQPVNLLKALNYHTRSTMNGFYVQPQPQPARSPTSPSPADPHVQLLAQTYSYETAQAVQNNSYKLASAIVHLGDVFSGHFITYRRTPTINGQRFPDRWLYTSDTHVKRTTSSDVLKSDAYMLFYEKI